jgi:hypothetical protein
MLRYRRPAKDARRTAAEKEENLTDRELWAVANETIRQHGHRAPRFVAERIGALVLKGDVEGVATRQEVARRVVQLGEHGKVRH